MASSSTRKPTIGILSIGDMGMGIAKLLLAHDFEVLTVSAGRSQHTVERIRAAKITDVASDIDLLARIDIILSIVPPRDALVIARRVADASRSAAGPRTESKGAGSGEIVFLDLNAISPRTVAKIQGIFQAVSAPKTAPQTPSLARRLTRTLSITAYQDTPEDPGLPPIEIKFLDGGIIGPPPSKPNEKSKEDDSIDDRDPSSAWKIPSIPLSGPHEDLLTADFLSTLNMKFISTKIGTASALKGCYASLTKGFTALSILSYTTAATCGVLPELRAHLDEFMPGITQRAESGLTGMPPKAHRWIDEMREIGTTFKSSGGMAFGGKMFDEVAEVYKFVANDTVLGQERIGKRKRGTTVEDVVGALEDGVQRKMQKREGKDEKLELAWRGSWGL